MKPTTKFPTAANINDIYSSPILWADDGPACGNLLEEPYEIATRTQYLERIFYRSCLESSATLACAPENLSHAMARSQHRAHTQLHQLKRQMLRSALELTPNEQHFKRLCGAANQAAALAWETGYPALVFPCLFEELTEEIRQTSPTQAARFYHVLERMP